MSPRWLLLIALSVLVAGAAWALAPWLSLEALQAQHQAWRGWTTAHPGGSAAAFVAVYVVATALSFPGATLLTLAGGAMFGLAWGTVLVSLASTLGASLAFLGARYLLRDAVLARFPDQSARLDAGVRRDGAHFLLSLRLVPVVPFFLVNLALGLTAMPVRTFAWVSQLGMLPGTLVYVNAGTELARLTSLADILSPRLWGAFALLALFPWLARGLSRAWQRRRRLAGHPRPRRFDRNLVVIGGGSAGLVTAYLAAAVRAKVTLVEQDRMGGDCLNTGCVPSKALLRAARFVAELQRAESLGFPPIQATFDFAQLMARVQRVVAAIAPHDSIERYTALGVEVLTGQARLVTPWQVVIRHADGSQTQLTTRSVVLASGAAPRVPAIPGLAEMGYLTSETVWSLSQLPARLLVLGGGPIGCELGQALARFGSAVTIVEQASRLLPREEPAASEALETRFTAEGVRVLTRCEANAFELVGGEKTLLATQAGQPVRLAFDAVLVAVGRTPRLTGLGLEGLGLLREDGLQVDDCLRTEIPHIYAAGDVVGRWQLTHAAAHQAWYAAVNALVAPFRSFPLDARVMPQAVFSEPEVARVGLTSEEATAQGLAFEVTRYALADLDRAIAEGETEGFVQVLTPPGRDRILGVTIVGRQAGELIAEWGLAMRHNLGLNAILGTVHVYPTLMEANKQVAGAWKRAHAPEGLLRWVARYHAWRRG